MIIQLMMEEDVGREEILEHMLASAFQWGGLIAVRGRDRDRCPNNGVSALASLRCRVCSRKPRPRFLPTTTPPPLCEDSIIEQSILQSVRNATVATNP